MDLREEYLITVCRDAMKLSFNGFDRCKDNEEEKERYRQRLDEQAKILCKFTRDDLVCRRASERICSYVDKMRNRLKEKVLTVEDYLTNEERLAKLEERVNKLE